MSYRDARTGEYVTEEFAKANPSTTVYVAGPKPIGIALNSAEAGEEVNVTLHGMDHEVTYKGITHSCSDPKCHVAGFVQTLEEQDRLEGNEYFGEMGPSQ